MRAYIHGGLTPRATVSGTRLGGYEVLNWPKGCG